MKKTYLTIALLGVVLAAASLPAGAQDPIPEEDLEVREYDELFYKDKPETVWKGEFRRDEQGRFEVTPNGMWIFDVQVGDSKGIVLRVLPAKVGYRLEQTEEEVWRKQFRKLPDLSYEDVNGFVKASKQCEEKGYLDLAEDLLRRALEIGRRKEGETGAVVRQMVDVYLRLGDLLRKRFKFDEELELYRSGLEKKFPDPERLLARIADLYARLGLTAEAEETYREALSQNDKHFASLLGLGSLYLGLRRFEEAKGRLAEAKEQAYTAEEKAEALWTLGRTQLKLGELQPARQSFEDAAYTLPDDKRIKNALGSVYFLNGEIPLAKQKFMEVIEITESDVASAPAEGDLAGDEGEEESGDEAGVGEEEGGGGEPGAEGVPPAGGEEEEAADPWGPATEFDPVKSRAMVNLALCLIREGSPDKAESYLRPAAGLDPTSSFPWIGVGRLREVQGRFGDAREAYEKACRIEPDAPDAHYALGVLHLRAGDEARARSAFLDTVEADPDFTDGLVKLGRLALKDGRSRDAVRYFERALTLGGDVADWLAELGIAYAQAGERARAGEAFERALDNDPAHAIARAGRFYALYYEPDSDEEAYIKMKRLLEDEGGSLPPPVHAYLENVVAQIEANRGKVQWKDGFDRDDSDQIARKWEQREGFGPVIRIHKGRVLIEGLQRRPGETRLEREVQASRFVKYESDLFAKDISLFEAGIFIAYRVQTGRSQGDIRAGIRLGKNLKGQLALWEYDVEISRWREVLTFGPWPVTESGGNRLAIEVHPDDESERGNVYKIRLYLNGEPLGDPYESDHFRRAFRTGEMWSGVFAAADEDNVSVKVEADNVRLVIRKP